MSALTITPNLVKKTAKVVGTVSAGEKVSVTLKDCATLNTTTLRLRVMLANKMLAVFPVPTEEGVTSDTFTVSGSDLTCTLNLCTAQMLQRFKRVPEMEVMFVLDDVAETIRQVYFFGFSDILGWPQEAGADTPIDLAGYGSKIAELEESISDLETKHEADIETVNANLENKVDKESGKGLSHVDVTTGMLGVFALKTELESHTDNNTIHITATERSAWNAKADGKLTTTKQDVIVQGGFIYIPDRDNSDCWRRMQAFYDEDMGGVTTALGDTLYKKNAEGTFEEVS